MLKAHRVTGIIFELIPAIEQGLGERVSIKDIEDHIHQGDIIPFLQEKFPLKESGADFSLYQADIGREDEKQLVMHLQQVLPAYEGRERRKSGVAKNGLCFLVGLCAEIIQRGEWKEPSY